MAFCSGVRFFFFFQAEDGIRDGHVTGVQTCALPIYGFTGWVRRAGSIIKLRVGSRGWEPSARFYWCWAAYGDWRLPRRIISRATVIGSSTCMYRRRFSPWWATTLWPYPGPWA